MKTALITAAFICMYAIQGGATESNTNQQGAGKSVEQKKVEILQHIKERITNSQAEITCVQAALSHDDLRACREKYRPAPPKNENRTQSPQHLH